MNKLSFRLAASALIIGMSTVGCQADDSRPAALSDAAPQSKKEAFSLHQEAQVVLRRGDVAQAVSLMENAVELSPRDAGYRMALAELYLRSGRFASAERTFSDTVILNPENVQASLYLALSRGAQGKGYGAIAALEAVNDRAKPADLGLAFALLGDTQRAVQLLESAARDAGADSRVRQNLALAYALGGDWAKARVIAAQDLSPADIDRRMEQWATLARPNEGGVQVAAFFGVTPVADAGQPHRLALHVAPEEAAFARADAVEVSAPPPEVEMEVALAPAPAPAPVEAPPVQLAVAAAPRPAVEAILPSRLAPAGRYVVQIGAFSSRGQAESAWKTASRRYQLAGSPLITTIPAPRGGGTFHRLAVRGFTTSGEAGRTCRSIKAKGGDCFVRAIESGRAPTRIAARR